MFVYKKNKNLKRFFLLCKAWNYIYIMTQEFCTNSYQNMIKLEGHTGEVNALTTLHDGNIASGSDDKTIKIWNVETGECINTLKRT